MCAFVVGNANYGETLGQLKYPKHDANEVVESLKSLGVKNDNIIKVINGDSFTMREEFDKFVKLCKRGDLAFIFFSGHGCNFNNHQCLMALPLSNERRMLDNDGRLQSILESSLQVDKMLAKLQPIGAKHLVLLDCCRASR